MKNTHFFMSIAILSALAFASGCTESREIELAGEAKAAENVTLNGPISIEFFEGGGEADAEPVSLKKIELTAAGEFKEMVDVAADSVHVLALNDLNKDGVCNDGEPWAQADAPVKEDGTVDRITLALSTAACPLVSAE